MTDDAKHPGGRPRLYPDAAALAAKVDEYFDGAPNPTMAGLCYFLGFADRHALTEYEGYEDEFSATVKRARLRIEQDRNERLIGKDTFTPGVIFDLKNNHGWKDKTEQEVTVSDDMLALLEARRRRAAGGE